MKTMGKLVMTATLVTLAACGGKNNDTTVTAKPPVAVECEQVKTAPLTESVEVTGTLEPKFSVDVKSQIPGLVKQVYINEWIRVKKGQLLARIDLSETEAQVKRGEAGVAAARASLSQAQVSQTRAEREQTRVKNLKESGLATQQALDDARSEYDASRARSEASRAQCEVAAEELRQARARLAKGVITAPIDGVVALKAINVGDLTSDAAAAKPLFRIVDNRLLNLTVTVPSSVSSRIKVGQALTFTVDSLPQRTFTGKVMYINPELSSNDRSLKIIAEVPNVPEQLKGGLFAKGRIVTGNQQNVIQIPRSALANWDTTNATAKVYLLAGDTVHAQPVKTGSVNGDRVEIVSGLTAGDQCVVRGGFNLKDGEKVTRSGAKP